MYADVIFRDQPEKLNQLGWGPRRDGSSLEAPGEVRDIRIVSEGDTWVTLRWNPPVTGGAVGAYQIQRKRKDTGVWEDVGGSVDTVQTVGNQPRGIEMDYRVVAVNKAGIGQPRFHRHGGVVSRRSPRARSMTTASSTDPEPGS